MWGRMHTTVFQMFADKGGLVAGRILCAMWLLVEGGGGSAGVRRGPGGTVIESDDPM